MLRKVLAVMVCSSSLTCAPGFGAPPIAPDPFSPGAMGATIETLAGSYTAHGITVSVVTPDGYAPGNIVYRWWNPTHGG